MNQYELFRMASPALPALAAFVVSLKRGRDRSSVYLQGLLLSAFFILVFSFCELSSKADAAILLFSHLDYACIAFAPVFWFVFCYQFGTGRRIGLAKLFAVFSVVPAATSAIAFSGSRTQLLWASSSIAEIGSLRVNAVSAYGPWFWIHFIYSYVLFIIGAVLVLTEFIGHFDLYRKQAVLVVAATGLPLIFNVAYVFRIVPGLSKDFSAIAIAASGILFTIGIRRYALLDINPFPRGGLDDYLDEGLVVVNDQGRILYRNAAAARVLGLYEHSLAIGSVLWASLPAGLEGFAARAEGPSAPFVASLPGPSGLRSVELSVKKLGKELGGEARYCVVMRQVSPWPPARAARAEESSALLSQRESEIAAFLADGDTLKVIAAKLFISENTVKTHVRHIYRKTGARTRRELAQFLGGSE